MKGRHVALWWPRDRDGQCIAVGPFHSEAAAEDAVRKISRWAPGTAAAFVAVLAPGMELTVDWIEARA